MSLLDTGPDTLLIWPFEDAQDDRGNAIRQPSATPVSVCGRLQARGSEESAAPANGQVISTLYKFIARSAPIGPWALAKYTAGPNTPLIGTEFDVSGEPELYAGSPRVRHVSALLRARSPRSI